MGLASAWLGSRERLWGILDFTKPELAKHADEKRAAFTEQVVKHLAAKLRDEDDRVGAVFDIDLVEDAIGWGMDELPVAPEKKKKSKGESGLPHSIGGLMSSLDAIELLAALQFTEQQTLQLIEKLKAFLIALFQVIDGEGRESAITTSTARWCWRWRARAQISHGRTATPNSKNCLMPDR